MTSRIVAPELPVHDEHLGRVSTAVLLASLAVLAALLLTPAPVDDALDVARSVLGHVESRRIIHLDAPLPLPTPSNRTRLLPTTTTTPDDEDPVPIVDDPPPK